MHMYMHHIGDIEREVSRLTDSQAMAYMRLMWRYLKTGEPIDDDIDSVAFAIGHDPLDVERILKAFYIKREGTGKWHRYSLDLEIAWYENLQMKKSDAGKLGAAARGNSKATGKQKKSKSQADAKHVINTCDEISSTCLAEPRTMNHEPVLNISANADIGADKKAKPVAIPDWLPCDAWLGFVEMRKAKKKPLTERAIHGIEKKLIAFMNQGFDISAILDQSTINGWTDVYAPKDNTGAMHHANNQRLTPAQQRTAESQRIDELLRQGAAGILAHSNQDIRTLKDCSTVAVPARLSDSRGSDFGSETLVEYVPAGEGQS